MSSARKSQYTNSTRSFPLPPVVNRPPRARARALALALLPLLPRLPPGPARAPLPLPPPATLRLVLARLALTPWSALLFSARSLSKIHTPERNGRLVSIRHFLLLSIYPTRLLSAWLARIIRIIFHFLLTTSLYAFALYSCSSC